MVHALLLIHDKDNDLNAMKDSNKLFKKLGFIGVGLCAVCCVLPIVGVMFGMGALTVLTGFLEWAGILAMIAAVVFLGVYYLRSKKAPACDIECGCTEEEEPSAIEP
jgi:hypothetical protein